MGLALTQDLIIYILGLAALGGAVIWRIGALERKVEKHNSMIERTYKLEGEVKQINDRLSSLEKKEEKQREN